MKIFIATTTFAQFSKEPITLLKKYGFKIKYNKKKRKLNEREIKNSIKDVDAVIAGTEIYNEKVLSSAKNLKIISRVGVGIDSIDLNYAKLNNIKVIRTKSSPALSVAELTLGLIIDCSRNISNQSAKVKNKKWVKHTGNLISGKKIGIIGLGSIGKKLVQLTKGFELKYYAYDFMKDTKFAKSNNIKFMTLSYIFKNCDIISIHLSGGAKNKNLINLKYLSYLKGSSILVNTSRGDILDEDGLIKVLNKKNNLSVGLDVFKEEPYNGKLIENNKTILTPHIGSYSKETRLEMELESAKNIIKFFE